VHFRDTDNFIISSFLEQSSITNKEPANLLIYSIEQGTKDAESITDYTIKFTPHNAIPTTGSIQMTYPQQITLTDGSNTVCEVTTTAAVYSSNCVVDPNSQTITVTDIFQSGTGLYGSEISINLKNVKNAINNRPGNGFVIQTYWDERQTYIMDKLNDFILRP
jgi:hypothetical protein